MTKEKYFEMCEMLGSEPIPDQIPVDHGDLYPEAQTALIIYNKLRDEWDSLNGKYLGKNYLGVIDIFVLYEVPTESRRIVYDLLKVIDDVRSKMIAAKTPQPPKQ